LAGARLYRTLSTFPIGFIAWFSSLSFYTALLFVIMYLVYERELKFLREGTRALAGFLVYEREL